MKILYDHQAFTIQNYGGISRYFFELTRALQAKSDLTVEGSLLFSNNEVIKENKVFPSHSFFSGIYDFQKKIETMNLLNELKSSWVYKQNDFDLFHPTYYDTYYLNLKSKKPIVLTFHDLIHEKFKQYDQRTLHNKRNSLNRADQIIAVSQHSKNDLMEYYRIPENKITVVHLASSIIANESVVLESPQEDYLLYVGNRNHYKNFPFFVKAIAPLLLKHSSLYLYCAGGGTFTKEEGAMFRETHIENKIKYYPGTDDSLTRMYSNALAFIFPSIYEGFGLPLLEAMSCGCPVGASETSSLPEVGGDSALYFNPLDKDSILSVVDKFVIDPQIRSTFKQRGLLRAKDFSWQKTADLTHQVYASMA